MKKVLWISRHCMTKEQIDDLKRITGEEIDIIPWKETLYSLIEIKHFHFHFCLGVTKGI